MKNGLKFFLIGIGVLAALVGASFIQPHKFRKYATVPPRDKRNW